MSNAMSVRLIPSALSELSPIQMTLWLVSVSVQHLFGLFVPDMVAKKSIASFALPIAYIAESP